MSEIDPDPEDAGRAELGGRPEPSTGDPTEGGKRGAIGAAPGVAADEPDDGTAYAPGGGRVAEEPDAPPLADPGPDA
jgi:hypothetical protein